MIWSTAKVEDHKTTWYESTAKQMCSRTCSTTDTCSNCPHCQDVVYYSSLVQMAASMPDDEVVHVQKPPPDAPRVMKPKVQRNNFKTHQPAGGWGFFRG